MFPDRNSFDLKRIESEFIKSYTPTTAWGNAIGMYQSLHALRGFWTMQYDENLNIIDYSGQGRVLTRVSTVINQSTAISPLVPYGSFDTGRYLYRNTEPGLELTGAAGLVGVSAQLGITWGTWIRPASLPGTSTMGIVSKYNTTGNQRSYMLYTSGSTANTFRCAVSQSGTAPDNFIDASSAFENGVWYCLVARWIPSTSLSIWVNGVKTETTTSIIPSVFVSTAPFEIGSFNYGSATWTHNQQFVFLCAAGLSDSVIKGLYHHTRALFGA